MQDSSSLKKRTIMLTAYKYEARTFEKIYLSDLLASTDLFFETSFILEIRRRKLSLQNYATEIDGDDAQQICSGARGTER